MLWPVHDTVAIARHRMRLHKTPNFIPKKELRWCWYSATIIIKSEEGDGIHSYFGNLSLERFLRNSLVGCCFFFADTRGGDAPKEQQWVKKRGTSTAFDLLTYTMLLDAVLLLAAVLSKKECYISFFMLSFLFHPNHLCYLLLLLACKLVIRNWNSCLPSFGSVFFTVCQTTTFNWYEIRISWLPFAWREATRNVERDLTVLWARNSRHIGNRVCVKVKLIHAYNVDAKRSKRDHDLGIFHRWKVFSDWYSR